MSVGEIVVAAGEQVRGGGKPSRCQARELATSYYVH